MADIMDRLRQMADIFEAQCVPHNMVLHLRAAADEIERIRQVLENTQQARVLQGKAITDANNEIERLRSGDALEYLGHIGQLSDELSQAKAENAKLRAALEPFACTCRDFSAECAWSKGSDKCINHKARAALGGE